MTIVKKKQNVKKHLYNSVGGSAPKIVSTPAKIKFGAQSITQKIKTVGSELFRPVARITRGATKLLYQAPAAFIAKRKYNTAKKAYITSLSSNKSSLTNDIKDDGHKLIYADVERSLQKFGDSGMQSHEAMKKIIASRINKYKSKITSDINHTQLTNKILENFKGTNSTIDNPMYKSKYSDKKHTKTDVQLLKTSYTNMRKKKGEQINKLKTLALDASGLSSVKTAFIKGTNLFRKNQTENKALNTYNRDVSADFTKLKGTAQKLTKGVGSAATYVGNKSINAAKYVVKGTKGGINIGQRFVRKLVLQSGITKAKDLLQNYSSASNSEKTQIEYNMKQKLNAGKASYATLDNLIKQSEETKGVNADANKLNIGHDIIRSGIDAKINQYTNKIGQSTTTDEEKTDLQTKLTDLGLLKKTLNKSEEMVSAEHLIAKAKAIQEQQKHEEDTRRTLEFTRQRNRTPEEVRSERANAEALYKLEEETAKNARLQQIRAQSSSI